MSTRFLGSNLKFESLTLEDMDLRKWAIEGLSYLSLDADVKEELADDQLALAALFDLCKVTKLSDTSDLGDFSCNSDATQFKILFLYFYEITI